MEALAGQVNFRGSLPRSENNVFRCTCLRSLVLTTSNAHQSQMPTKHFTLGLEKKLLVSCNGPKKNRVGRSVKKKCFAYFFGQKCVFYACFTLIGSWEGGENLLNKNLLG